MIIGPRGNRVAAVAKRGFESSIAVGHHRYVEIQAVGGSGRVLARSRIVRAG